ncbi:hypothetical protein ACFX1R_023773 [Malus domestica]
MQVSVLDIIVVLEEVVRKTHSFKRLKVEAKKCVAQNEKITNEKIEFESAIYAKFLGVLNSKKAKLREIRDNLSKQKVARKLLEEEEVIPDQTKPYVSGDENNEEEPFKDLLATSKDVLTTRSRGRGRKRGVHK